MTTQDRADPVKTLILLGMLAAIVALLGGSSRPDAVQMTALRPMAALILIPAFYTLSTDQIRTAKVLVTLLVALVLWVALQLLPLPPSVWHALPEREAVATLDSATGHAELWRPISWVPSRGWNTLASLTVPAAALLLALSLSPKSRTLLLLITAIGTLDALLALLQVASGRAGALYFYEVTNRHSPVGIFANENHSGVFSAITLLVLARLGFSAKRVQDPPWLRLAYPPVFVVVLLASIVSGSRAGLAMTLLALLVAGAIGWLSFTQRRRSQHGDAVQRWVAGHPRALLMIFVAAVMALFGVFFGLERAPGVADTLNNSPFDDLRWHIWPTLERMIGEFWFLGIGFGSFEEVYHIYETTELLGPRYVNHAHNDWAQWVIEGGLPALALLAALLGWIGFSILSLVARQGSSLADLLFWGATIAILCAASLVDYPLRTPTFMLAATWLLLALAIEKDEINEMN